MDETFKKLTKLLLLIGSLILLYLLVIFVASVGQLALAADRIYLGLGQPVFIFLISILALLAASPIYIYFRFPKALVPPDETTGPEHDKYMAQLRRRLASNPMLVGTKLSSDEDVNFALVELSKETDKIIRETAGAVFLGTAISQNGKLDGLISLLTQGRMVWRIAGIYNQRPSPRQMLYLYSNVAANVFLAESLDDLDISEIITPLLTSAGFGAVGAVPGFSIVTNGLADGATNAFFTLRVGCIAKQYCVAISTPNKSRVRRVATLAAAGMLGGIVKENSIRIFAAAKNITIDSARNAASKISDTVVHGAQAVGSSVESAFDEVKSVTGKATDTVIQGTQSVVSSTVEVAKSTTGIVAGTVIRGAQSVGSGVGSTINSTVQYVKGIVTRKD